MSAAGIMIVTGGSRGIGAATVRAAGRAGYDVCINYRSGVEQARALVDELQAMGRRAIAVCADMAQEADIVQLFEATDRTLGPVSVLVNNAGGVPSGRHRVDAIRADELDHVLRLNLGAVILASREAVKRMSTAQGGAGGAIVNVSSASARLGAPNLWMDYAAAKGGVDTFTQGLAIEIAEEGIRVNGVRPGLIDTEMHAATGMPDRVVRAAKHLPMKRAGTAEEVAEAILWLASPAASYVSGAIIDVAGAR
jgi:NAD(P)-dependent dehydrogenase (short-subunit alcohol dehydrogenase family)